MIHKKNIMRREAPIIPVGHARKLQREISEVLSSREGVARGDLRSLVGQALTKKEALLNLAQKYPTPFYVFDKSALKDAVDSFTSAFNVQIPNFKAYYAMKVNHHPLVVKTVIERGMGIDASSGREVSIALKLGARDILFTGPAKAQEELELALSHSNKIIVNIDSFSELRKLATLAFSRKIKVRAGVRIFTKEHGAWSKFGIPLKDLAAFWREASGYPFVDLQGIQFHSSFNDSVKPYQKNIAEVAKYLKMYFSSSMLRTIRFLDFGGGFEARNAYGHLPWVTPAGQIIQAVDEYFGRASKFSDRYYITQTPTLIEYARGIARAIETHLHGLVQCAYFFEPGHVICDPAMHILLRVADKKKDNHVISSGGRVLGITAYESNVKNACLKAYSVIGKKGIHFERLKALLKINSPIAPTANPKIKCP